MNLKFNIIDGIKEAYIDKFKEQISNEFDNDYDKNIMYIHALYKILKICDLHELKILYEIGHDISFKCLSIIIYNALAKTHSNIEVKTNE